MGKRKKKSRRKFLSRGIILGFTSLIFLIALMLKVPLHKHLGISGQGYLSVALEWFCVCLILGTGNMFHAVSRMVSLRVEKGSIKNAKRVVVICLSMSLLTGVVLTAAVFLGADLFAGKISNVELSVPALKCLAAAILPLCLMSVLMGGLDGLGFSSTAMVPGMTACIFFIGFGVWSVGAFREYGDNVGALLQNVEYGPAYAAFGYAVSVAVSSWIGFLVSIMGWIYKKRNIYVLAANESGYQNDHEKNVVRGVINRRMNGLFTLWIPVIFIFLQNIFFQNIAVKKLEQGSIIDWGSFTGAAGNVMILPLFAVIGFAVRQLPGFHLAFERRNLKKSRQKLLVSMRAMALLAVPCAAFITVLAKQICGAIIGYEDELTVNLIRISGLTVVFWGIAVVLACVIWSMRHEKLVPIGLLISGVFSIFVQFLLLRFTKLGIRSVVITDLMWAVLLSVIYYMTVTRLEKLRISWLRVFLPPVIGTVIASLVCFFTSYFCGQIAPAAIVCLISAVAGVLIYFISEIAIHGIDQRILSEYPGGDKIFAVAHFLRLM